MSSSAPVRPRLASLDQFRGYTMAGMFFVNFLADYSRWAPPVLLHHHTYCSYADTIMPHFLFAVGFAMRLSFGRAKRADGEPVGYGRMVRRILGLLLVAFAVYTDGKVAESWHALGDRGAWDILFPFLKREWLQTLGQIALTSLWILPVVCAGAAVRIGYLIFSALLHVGLSHWFNFLWVNTHPPGIDGGPLGFLSWSIPALLGTLTCDAILNRPEKPPLVRLVLASVLIMGLGYVFSCGTRLYDLSPSQLAEMKAARVKQDAEVKKINDEADALSKQVAEREKALHALDDGIDAARRAELIALAAEIAAKPESSGRPRRRVVDQAEHELAAKPPSEAVGKLISERDAAAKQAPPIAELKSQSAALKAKARSFLDVKFARSPVVPPREAWEGRNWQTLLAEPPFVGPPADDPRVDPEPRDLHRNWNYWMMTQRAGSISYTTFAGGFSILVYVLFYLLADVWGIRFGVLRTFGSNALAGYVLAGIIGGAMKAFIPNDAPWWYSLGGFGIDMYLIWLFLRSLEKNNIYLRV